MKEAVERREENNQENIEFNQEVLKILDEIAVAAGNALTVEHFNYVQEKGDKLAKRIMRGGKLSDAEKKFMADVRPNEVIFPNLEVMKESFIRLNLSKEFIEESAKHEEAHFKAAQGEGLSPCYMIRFFKDGKGSVTFVPAVRVGLKENEQKTPETRDGLKKIARAPSDPSKSDLRKIE